MTEGYATSTTLQTPDHVVARRIGDRLLIVDLSTGSYYGLDPTAAIVWAGCSEGDSFGTICDRMEALFEVDRKELEADVAGLMETMVVKGLAHPRRT